MTYSGIDYGRGLININVQTGIRYGVISAHTVDYWYEEAEAVYNFSCPRCGAEPSTDDCPKCSHCGYEGPEEEWWGESPTQYVLDDGAYRAVQSGDDCDVFVTLSPYFTYAQLCSPCAPGACYLGAPLSRRINNNRCYCFGHDHFADGMAPYPVYDVVTGKLVAPNP